MKYITLVLCCSASLVSIHSEEENWFVWEKLREADPDEVGGNFWLGMTKDDSEVDETEGNFTSL